MAHTFRGIRQRKRRHESAPDRPSFSDRRVALRSVIAPSLDVLDQPFYLSIIRQDGSPATPARCTERIRTGATQSNSRRAAAGGLLPKENRRPPFVRIATRLKRRERDEGNGQEREQASVSVAGLGHGNAEETAAACEAERRLKADVAV